MSCVTDRCLVNAVCAGGPNLALRATALVGVQFVCAGSLGRAAAFITSLTEGARLGARLRVKSLTASVSCCHAAVGTIRSRCARQARVGGTFGCVGGVASSSITVSTRWACNRLSALLQTVVTGRTIVATTLGRSSWGCPVGAGAARRAQIIFSSRLTKVPWWTVSHTVRADRAVVSSCAIAAAAPS